MKRGEICTVGVSQYRLVKLGISNTTLTRLKRNEAVNTETLGRLCGILNCEVEDIMENMREKTHNSTQ